MSRHVEPTQSRGALPASRYFRTGRPQMQREVIGAAVIAMAIGSTAVSAQSLKDKEYFAREERSLADKLPSVAEACGTTIAVKFDWSKPPSPEERTTYSASSYCSAVLDGMQRVCASSHAGKDAVKRAITKLTCGFGPQRSITLKNGAIVFRIDYGASNNVDYVFEYLQSTL